MHDIQRYVLVDKEGVETQYEYEHYTIAEDQAKFAGWAVRSYTFKAVGPATLVYTPDNAVFWPPVEDTSGHDLADAECWGEEDRGGL